MRIKLTKWWDACKHNPPMDGLYQRMLVVSCKPDGIFMIPPLTRRPFFAKWHNGLWYMAMNTRQGADVAVLVDRDQTSPWRGIDTLITIQPGVYNMGVGGKHSTHYLTKEHSSIDLTKPLLENFDASCLRGESKVFSDMDSLIEKGPFNSVLEKGEYSYSLDSKSPNIPDRRARYMCPESRGDGKDHAHVERRNWGTVFVSDQHRRKNDRRSEDRTEQRKSLLERVVSS